MVIVKGKKTPEEEKSEEKKRREQEAQAFIQEREKKASREGISSKRAAEEMIPGEAEKLSGEVARQRGEALQPLIGQIGRLPVTETPTTPGVPGQPSAFMDFLTGANLQRQAEAQGGRLIQGTAPIIPAGAIPAAANIGTKIFANAGKAKSILATAGIPLTAGAVAGKVGVGKRQAVKNAQALYSSSTSNIQRIINSMNSREISPSDGVRMFNEEIQNINSAEAALHLLTNNKLEAFLSGGKDELVKLRAYKNVVLPIQQEALTNAILNPNPTAFFNIPEDEQEV
jgi:hypothetical protein